MQPIPFTQADNKGRSSRFSSERLVNLYPEIQENAKYPYAVYGTPGLSVFEDNGPEPVRGIITRNVDRFFISGGEVYRNGVLLAGVSLAGTGHVSMATNSTQLVIVAGGRGYVVRSTVELITDPDWKTADTVTFLAGVFVFNERGTGRAFSSEIGDASDLDALDFATAESSSDNLVGVYTEGDKLVMAGTRTIEFWFPDGGPQFPFSKISSVAVQTGIVSPHGVAFNDNTFFFVGHDLSVYRMGQVPTRISTPHIERRIKGFANQNKVVASTYAREGHVFIIFDFDDGTLVYDAATNKWHERISYKRSSWRCSFVWQDGKTVYAGSKADGKVYTLEEGMFSEDGIALESLLQTPQIGNAEEWFRVMRVKIDMQTGVGLTTGQGSNPQVMMQYSDDGGKTWSYELWGTIGQIGEYFTVIDWRRLGRSKQRIFRFKITDPVQRAFLGLWLDG